MGPHIDLWVWILNKHMLMNVKKKSVVKQRSRVVATASSVPYMVCR